LYFGSIAVNTISIIHPNILRLNWCASALVLVSHLPQTPGRTRKTICPAFLSRQPQIILATGWGAGAAPLALLLIAYRSASRTIKPLLGADQRLAAD
jgi:hypothetical protein